MKKTTRFIKLTAKNAGELVEITLNTSKIGSYAALREDGDEPKCRLIVSSSEGSGCDIMYVMETKEYLDLILT